MGSLRGIEIASTGSYVPETVVANEDLAALGCDSNWIVQRTGILERRRAAPEQATSDLALAAARKCLERANLAPSEVDLILVATITPDQASPSTACHLQRQLGCIAPAMDLNAACAGFMYGLVTGSQFVATGAARNVLVVGAEVMSRTINPQDVKTYPLFGDGAGAVLLRPTQDSSKGLLSYTLGAEGCGGQMLCIPSGGSRLPLTAQSIAEGAHFLHMEGRAVFKWAVRVVADSTRDCLAHSQVAVKDLDMMILHQANTRIIDAAVSDFNIDPDKVYVNLDRFGNTSAASIPLALDEVMSAGRIGPGSKLLLCGFGSGLAWGTAVMQL
ncbi:beta-ketoacyl-ACP synthase III [Aureliella helgolandensis]|uniref:beta-ketoacyl-ACP synthase III n=1 Tax=Aureliella helgolandensis TaxID=2527968 RepID=UPI0011A07074|nr:beta-ketoacyl-ACP synthase III [Aureliella helgolandensis]